MWKVILALVLAGGGYYLYTTLEARGTLGAGSSALNKLENKKNEDFNQAKPDPEETADEE